MQRFILYILVLITAFTLTLSAVFLSVRRQSLPDYIAALHFTDCAIPCWIGIEPGKTTTNEARQRLTMIFNGSSVFTPEFPTATSEGTIWLTLHNRVEPSASVEVLIFTDHGVVTAIDFNIYSGMIFSGDVAYPTIPIENALNIAKLHALFGAPSRMILPNMTLNRLEFLTLIYGNDDQGMLAHVLTLNPDAPIISMVYYGNSGPLKADTTRIDQIQPWRGFVSSKRYIQMLLKITR